MRMNENKELDLTTRESAWMKFLTLAAMFVGTSTSSTGMGAADWIGMVNSQSQFNSLGGRF